MKRVRAFFVAVAAVAVSGSVMASGPTYTLTIGSAACSPGGQTQVAVNVEFPDEAAANVAGISFGVCHDPQFIDINCVGGTPNDCVDNGIIVPGADLAMVNDGDGPDFFAPATTTAPQVGFTVGLVVNLLGGDSLPNVFPEPSEVVLVTYRCIAETPGGKPTPLNFCETGDPAVLISVGLAGGGDVVPETVDGGIAVATPMGFPFIRGDVDVDGRFFGIFDAVFLLESSLLAGSTLPCLDAADADADGTVDAILDATFILNANYLPGSPLPPAPFGPFPDACAAVINLGCEVPGACP